MIARSLVAAIAIVVLIAPPSRNAGARPTASPPAASPPAASPIVVELFTSQSCSSCPPADDLLTELARTRPDILALDFHVTYWDRLGWKDPYSLPQATQRQRRYSELWGRNGVYTPQLVAGGRHQAVGSDRGDVLAAITAAAAEDPAALMQLGRDAAGLVLDVGAGHGAGTLLLVGFDAAHVTRIAGGENGGRTLTEVNVVRSVTAVGPWRGEAVSLHASQPAGERTVALLQAEDGRLLAAALLPLS